MKVFWSWQSDTPGGTGRFFVRDIIKECLDDIVDELSLEEPMRDAELAKIHFDQDRQGVPGIPDLTRTILSKIEAASVVIADVTPVGAVAGDNAVAKKLINSNVAIELGYSLATHGDSYIIMIMNSHYGKHADLPFDLRAKAGPIMYQLAPEASGEQKSTQRAAFKASLKRALKECLIAKQKEITENQSRAVEAKQVGSAEWERMASLIATDCLGLSADSQYQSDTKETTWTLKGGRSGICRSHLVRAGAMLLRSPKVRASLPSLQHEPDHLTRWLTALQQRGCASNSFLGESHDENGVKVFHVFSTIQDLAVHSKHACLDFANKEY